MCRFVVFVVVYIIVNTYIDIVPLALLLRTPVPIFPPEETNRRPHAKTMKEHKPRPSDLKKEKKKHAKILRGHTQRPWKTICKDHERPHAKTFRPQKKKENTQRY